VIPTRASCAVDTINARDTILLECPESVGGGLYMVIPTLGKLFLVSGVEVGAEVHEDKRIYLEGLSKLEGAAGAIQKEGIRGWR